jgi:hypothetical protein
MVPWEKDYYVNKLLGHLDDQRKKYEEQSKEVKGRTSL